MKGRGGYSLFEVLIAFAIMSVVLAALLPGQAALLARAKNQEQTLLAHEYALSRLAALGIAEDVAMGQVAYDYRDWAVNVFATPGIGSIAFSETQIISVTISDNSGRALASVETARIMP